MAWKPFTPLYMAIAAGLMLFGSWPESPLTLLIFIALVPLFWIESTAISRKKFFWLTYVAMFIWNIASTWWIWNASPPGAVAAFLANSFLMCLPWLGLRIAKKWLGRTLGYLSFIAFWMCFEFIHLSDWGLSWPWLTMGNVFSTHPEWVQWYEYTGTSGGTLWILVSNILVFALFKEYHEHKRSKRYFLLIASWLLLFIVPAILYRLTLSKPVTDIPVDRNIVVVQPNIDPYEKVSESTGSFEAQLSRLIKWSEAAIDEKTALVVWPETALYAAGGIDETSLKQNYFLAPLWGFLQRYPQITLFTGVESFRYFPSKTKYSSEYKGQHYETYNGSVLVDSAGAHGFYHKSMLVPGVETLPWFLRFLSTWFEKFGGTSGGYAKQDDRSVLVEKNGFRIAPAICYESIYGEFMSRYIKSGANLICIITNDGWWDRTPGHRQHLHYARLRAIETRTWIARSANTGISCFIDPYGNVIKPLPYDTEGSIKLNISILQPSKTFFVKHGDLLSRIMVGLSIVFAVWIIIKKILQRFFRNKFPALQPKAEKNNG